MATVIRFSAIVGILLVALKMALVWNDNKIPTPNDKALAAIDRAIDESTRKRRESAEQHEYVLLVSVAFARATRAFISAIWVALKVVGARRWTDRASPKEGTTMTGVSGMPQATPKGPSLKASPINSTPGARRSLVSYRPQRCPRFSLPQKA